MIPRHLDGTLRAALDDRPVVLLNGARQVGKSTLARAVADAERPPRSYLTGVSEIARERDPNPA